MFARIVKLNLKANHTTDFNDTFEKLVMPMLRKEKGFQDEIIFAGPSGNEMVSISLLLIGRPPLATFGAVPPGVVFGRQPACGSGRFGSDRLRCRTVRESAAPARAT